LRGEVRAEFRDHDGYWRRDQGDDHDAELVEVLPPGGEGAAGGEHRYPEHAGVAQDHLLFHD
jgi:hypothetical protein